jgi:hypothetical protein
MTIANRVAARWLAARARQRRQKGQGKLDRQRRYRRQRQKAKRQSAQYRRTHKTQVKRYQKKYRRNPSRFMRRRASVIAFSDIPFYDLEHGMGGEVQQVNLDDDLVQTSLDGTPKEYGLWDFLDTVVFPDEGDEGEFFGVLDDEFEWSDDDADDDGVSDEEDEDFDLGPSGV